MLARKYRPRSFDDLIGQEVVVRTLKNAFASGRIAHAFMLSGVRGVGKTTTARILARALNYADDTTDAPCVDLAEEGQHCASIMAGSHVDVIEMDAASRTGIDNIREIIENVHYQATLARYKIYIIDEVHMLSRAAFNGLLKTLEEPPPHVKFIFATTEIRKVPVTVLSRCQRFDLRRLTPEDTLTLLEKVCTAEQVRVPPEGLAVIARAADGSARDALSLLDRALAHMGEQDAALDGDAMRALLGLADRGRTFDMFDHVMSARVAEALAEFEAQHDLGADPVQILADLADLTYWLTRLKFTPDAGDDASVAPRLRERGAATAQTLGVPVLARAWQLLLKGHDETSRAANPRQAAEMVLIRLAHLAETPTPEALLRDYEKAPATPASAASAAPAPEKTQASAPVVSAAAPRPVADFAALVALAAEHREIALTHALQNKVHLVAFAAPADGQAGRIELRLAEGQDDITKSLTECLAQWTGQSWNVVMSEAEGAPTLAAARAEAEAQRARDAGDDPVVKAALDNFPGAEIVSVRSQDTPTDDGR